MEERGDGVSFLRGQGARAVLRHRFLDERGKLGDGEIALEGLLVALRPLTVDAMTTGAQVLVELGPILGGQGGGCPEKRKAQEGLEGPRSNAATASTPPQPDTVAPMPPTGLRVVSPEG